MTLRFGTNGFQKREGEGGAGGHINDPRRVNCASPTEDLKMTAACPKQHPRVPGMNAMENSNEKRAKQENWAEACPRC